MRTAAGSPLMHGACRNQPWRVQEHRYRNSWKLCCPTECNNRPPPTVSNTDTRLPAPRLSPSEDKVDLESAQQGLRLRLHQHRAAHGVAVRQRVQRGLDAVAHQELLW